MIRTFPFAFPFSRQDQTRHIDLIWSDLIFLNGILIARRLRSLSSVCSRDRDNQLSPAQRDDRSPYLIALDSCLFFVSYVIRLASRIGGLVTLLRSKVSTGHVVQGHDVMCAKADRCGTFTLPYLYLLLLPCYRRTDYGDDGTCNWYCYCCLLFVDDDGMFCCWLLL